MPGNTSGTLLPQPHIPHRTDITHYRGINYNIVLLHILYINARVRHIHRGKLLNFLETNLFKNL